MDLNSITDVSTLSSRTLRNALQFRHVNLDLPYLLRGRQCGNVPKKHTLHYVGHTVDVSQTTRRIDCTRHTDVYRIRSPWTRSKPPTLTQSNTPHKHHYPSFVDLSQTTQPSLCRSRHKYFTLVNPRVSNQGFYFMHKPRMHEYVCQVHYGQSLPIRFYARSIVGFRFKGGPLHQSPSSRTSSQSILERSTHSPETNRHPYRVGVFFFPHNISHDIESQNWNQQEILALCSLSFALENLNLISIGEFVQESKPITASRYAI